MPRKRSDLSRRSREAMRRRISRARQRIENQRKTDSPRDEEHANEILCEQVVKSDKFMAIKSKIKEECDLPESQNDDISNIHTEITIKQEDLEEIDISVPDVFSVSCSQMNTEVKEEPGSTFSDVSKHLDAADSPEEQAINNEMRQKMKMIIKNEEILKKRRKEISILENNEKELLAYIKYLQKIYKKK